MKPFYAKVINDQLSICSDGDKVLGKVTSENEWVTEGMRFDESELMIWVWDGEDGRYFEVAEWLEQDPTKYEDVYTEIKCPHCGFFN